MQLPVMEDAAAIMGVKPGPLYKTFYTQFGSLIPNTLIVLLLSVAALGRNWK